MGYIDCAAGNFLFNLTRAHSSCILATSGQDRRGETFRTPPGSKDSNGKEEFSGAADSLLGHFLFIIPPMKLSNWIALLVAAITGIAAGLIYGWVVSPVQYVDVTPGIMRADYRADYVLMVAEAHQHEQDSETSARRLAMLGSDSPAKIVEATLIYAAQNGFTENEIIVLQGLLTAMQTYQPQGSNAP